MAKFTVYFKDNAIHTGVFDSGVVHIGRDETNDLVVDSLAVAPAHAVAVIKDGNCVLKQLNEKFPLLVNDQHTKEWSLQNNDIINIGKHYIVYNTTDEFSEKVLVSTPADFGDADVRALNEKLEDAVKSPEANLQVLNGMHIGRILRLKKAMTRLGHEGAGVIVIARRKDGYFLSALQGHEGLAINDEPLGDRTVQLQRNDVIVVDSTSMQFFLD
ncbi:FHA domain-containing protein [Methylomonas fluvii]|uniref:FHA domain-containing protein n=1 Tax=Methylomonas fluvii TaxID=1854564 RepID=A0ABR9DKZ3_9GAMM|nr:FHA domain-containing protein [Methylomonas fluvii]MBD9363491.1 FHA domain-containing protein [Methylomonas fluvii]CAD6876780.1 Forkhead-associated protein [Methylomonas fluvii]